MNDSTIGRALRVLRLRTGLRQADVAARAGVSQQLVSHVERGAVTDVAVRTLRKLFEAVGAEAVTVVRWRAGDLDRLLDEGHAALVQRVVELLRRNGWDVFPEFTFSEWGERGSIDVLAWHPGTRTLLVIEVKTEVTSAEETLRRHDVKVRVAGDVARKRLGLAPRHVAKLLVVADRHGNRLRVERLRGLFATAYPARGRLVRAWLRDPSTGPGHGSADRGAMAALAFMAEPPDARRRTVRRAHARASRPPPPLGRPT